MNELSCFVGDIASVHVNNSQQAVVFGRSEALGTHNSINSKTIVKSPTGFYSLCHLKSIRL